MPKRDNRTLREQGAVVKDWGGRLPVALVYPNRYYLGMSNLGVQAIYKLLNDYDDVVCERVFWNNDNPPLSIESRRPLADFAMLAFSLSYELDYFNIAAILKAANIPLYSADRDARHPLVIAGGPCVTANPMPVAPFFDAICIGEAEALLPAVLPILQEGLPGSRNDLFKALAALPGVYVPAYPPQKPVVRQWAEDIDAFTTTSVVLTPDTELGDLYLIEAERGCPRGCRFCLVNGVFSPARFRSVDNLILQAQEGLKYRQRIGLVGPAVSDHPQILELLDGLLDTGARLSISSLRIGPRSGEVIARLARGDARTATIAPEAGSARLRRAIHKDIPDDDILAAADAVGRHGFKNLKLYFMVGLPTETDEDIRGIVRLALAMKSRLDKHRGGTRLNLNVAPFVPKAGTPFQWLPMAPPETLNRRLAVLKKELPGRGVALKVESPAWSRVQGILSRGDAAIAQAIADTDEVTLSGWRRAVTGSGLDIGRYIDEKWDTTQPLPWFIIDTGCEPARLRAEMAKAVG